MSHAAAKGVVTDMHRHALGQAKGVADHFSDWRPTSAGTLTLCVMVCEARSSRPGRQRPTAVKIAGFFSATVRIAVRRSSMVGLA